MGTHAVRLRDNSSSSKITSEVYDLSTFSNLTLDFTYYAQGTENGDDFFFEVSTNGGSSFTIVETWVRGTDFNNNVREYENITFSGPFTNQTVFRFRNDMTNNGDRVHLDNIVIDGCTTGTAAQPFVQSNELAFTNDVELTEEEEEELASQTSAPNTQINADSPISQSIDTELKVFPNPVQGTLNIIGIDSNIDFEIIHINGAVVKHGNTDSTIEVQDLDSGTYIIRASDLSLIHI